VLACRLVRAPAQTRTRTAWLAIVAGVAAGVAFFATAEANVRAASTDPESERLQSANDRLASESQTVVLELYALESQLSRAEARLADLRAETAAVERREEAARRRLELVRRTLAEAEDRLGERLRDLYMQGDPDPLAVLLGAETLDEAVATLDNLGSVARQDRAIIGQIRDARAELRSAWRELDARAAELRAVVREAERARAALAATRAERTGYLARLLRERRLNEAQLARLAARAGQAGARTAGIQAAVPDPPADDGEEAAGSEAPESPTPPPAAGAPGTQMTVSATGYCLQGSTATGIPVGWGVIAVDPLVIPLGTRITVPGYGEGVAADTGGSVRGAVIDLWFPTCKQASTWGRRTVTISLH
jgi:3D (Asp-Asp-Asp) domain-containing protein